MRIVVLSVLVCLLAILHQSDGYAYKTQDKLKTLLLLLIRELYFMAEMQIEKLKFIKRWAFRYKGVRTGEFITKTQTEYQALVRLYLNALDNVETYSIPEMINRLTLAKRMGMEIEHKAFLILEFENSDPSGKKYGRSGNHDEEMPFSKIVRSRNMTRMKQEKDFMEQKIKKWAKKKGLNLDIGKKPDDMMRFEDGFDSEKDK